VNISNRIINAIQWAEASFTQSENSALTYTINYAAILQSDTIATSTWSCKSTGVTIVNETNTTSITSAKLSGTPGQYNVLNTIATAVGDTIECTVKLTIAANEGSAGKDYE
jgi:hypothetical protein